MRRKSNEDFFVANDAQGLWIVADGMGGLEHGQLASETACLSIAKSIQQGYTVNHALIEAHAKVIDKFQGMGTTVVVVQRINTRFAVYWLGDSRAYQIASSHIIQLTTDHSFVQRLVDKGLLTPDEARRHPRRNIIEQFIGVHSEADITPGVCECDIIPGQKLLLCSDGLSEELTDEQILTIVNQHHDLNQLVKHLVDEAKSHGGKDNITALVISAIELPDDN